MVRKKVKIVTYQLSEVKITDGNITGESLPEVKIVEGTDRKVKKYLKTNFKERDIRVVGKTEAVVTYEMETEAFIENAKVVEAAETVETETAGE